MYICHSKYFYITSISVVAFTELQDRGNHWSCWGIYVGWWLQSPVYGVFVTLQWKRAAILNSCQLVHHCFALKMCDISLTHIPVTRTWQILWTYWAECPIIIMVDISNYLYIDFCFDMIILYPEFLALLAKYLCQRLTVLQESCKMAKFLKYNKLPASVVNLYL
jgi:hypothetical protein